MATFIGLIMNSKCQQTLIISDKKKQNHFDSAFEFGRYKQTRTADLYNVKVCKYYLNYIFRVNWRKFGVNAKLSTAINRLSVLIISSFLHAFRKHLLISKT